MQYLYANMQKCVYKYILIYKKYKYIRNTN